MPGLKPMVVRLKDVEGVLHMLRIVGHESGAGSSFRGQADISWPLLPKAGRREHYLPKDRDLGRFREWKHDAFPYLDRSINTDWELLAYAQHHGLATRLLDWTGNPLIAVYFAVNSHPDKDGVVFSYQPDKWVVPEKAKLDQSNLHGAALLTRWLDGRMLNQKGLFTVHSPPNALLPLRAMDELKGLRNDLNEDDLVNLWIHILPKELKPELRKTLDRFGINESVIFPDVDGVSRHINWNTTLMVRDDDED